jgi:glycosyl transferase family 2
LLTVLLATARAPKCFAHLPEWDQFDVLARNLIGQSFKDFELVVVTPFVEEARTSLKDIERLTVVPPRDTPWRRERMFAVCSARNTGLTYARGDWVLVIDDCVEFLSDFLERIVIWSRQGCGVSVMYKKPNGEICDSRWSRFLRASNNGDSIILRGSAGPSPFGFVSFPINTAVAINGYDELHFDGARGLEDINFARRLMQKGVPFAMDRRIMAVLHDHLGYPNEILDNEEQNARCCNTAHTLSQVGVVANKTRYTNDEKQKILNCMFWRDGGGCRFHGKACAYPKWAKDGHPVARRVMLNDEEELFDLAAAREIGLS